MTIRTHSLDIAIDFPEDYTAYEPEEDEVSMTETEAYSEDVAAHAENTAQPAAVQDTGAGRFILLPVMLAVIIAAAASGVAFALKAPKNKVSDGE